MRNKILLFLAIICLIFAIFSFTACGDIEKYDVVCTIFPQYDFCRRIAGEELSVKMLLPAGTDAHNYQLTTRDKSAIANCKLFVYVGGESEKWVTDVYKSVNASKIKWLDLSKQVGLISDDRDEEDEHNHSFDEHFYLSIKNAIILCESVKTKLIATFPDKAETFEANCEKLVSELTSLDTLYSETFNNMSNKTAYFADRYPFAYLFRDYGIECNSLFGGCSTDTEITPQKKVNFENEYKASGKSGVFVLENGNTKVAESVTEKCGGKIYTLDSCQTVTKKELDGGVGYCEKMRKNLDVLKEGLK